VIDADEIGHKALELDADIRQELIRAFGIKILKNHNEIDRQRLGEMVFNDAKSLAQLNEIMHPKMYSIVEDRIKKYEEEGFDVIVLEAAALIEADWTSLVDKVLVTAADEEVIVERIQKRSELSENQIFARIRSQLSSEERLKHADFTINTNGSLSEVKEIVKKLWDEIKPKDKKQKKLD
jgi:dephospho-CoA kinase